MKSGFSHCIVLYVLLEEKSNLIFTHYKLKSFNICHQRVGHSLVQRDYNMFPLWSLNLSLTYITFSLHFCSTLSVSLFNNKSFECRCKSDTQAFDSAIINRGITHWHLWTWIYTVPQNIITAAMQIIMHSRPEGNQSES